MLGKPTKYQERIRVLREQARNSDMRALEELYKRYHVNEIMINNELLNLKEMFAGSVTS
ncbi:MAG TPA: hypothetical protein VMT04_04780 [Terriglobales bacterium]|nr:hypothetical protein [Terriglobales bacterium]